MTGRGNKNRCRKSIDICCFQPLLNIWWAQQTTKSQHTKWWYICRAAARIAYFHAEERSNDAFSAQAFWFPKVLMWSPFIQRSTPSVPCIYLASAPRPHPHPPLPLYSIFVSWFCLCFVNLAMYAAALASIGTGHELLFLIIVHTIYN